MTQKVQELIDKIKTEGFQEAEKKAHETEKSAQEKARKIIDEAQQKTQQMIIEAKEEIKKMQESTHMALKQSSRDVLLSLRKEINVQLKNIINHEIRASLSTEKLADIISGVIKESAGGRKGADVMIAVNEADRKILENGFLSRLQDQVKNKIRL